MNVKRRYRFVRVPRLAARFVSVLEETGVKHMRICQRCGARYKSKRHQNCPKWEGPKAKSTMSGLRRAIEARRV